MIEQLDTRWAGDVAYLRSIAQAGWPAADAIARPDYFLLGRVGVITVAGVLTRSAWRRLAAAFDYAADDPEAEVVALAVSSPVQQVSGFSAAAAALQSCERRKMVVAHIDLAAGLALPLVCCCRLLFASPTAKFGLCTAGYPFGVSPESPSAERLTDALFAFEDCKLRPTAYLGMRLRDGYLHAEQLEERLVHFLTQDAAATIAVLNRAAPQEVSRD